RVRRSPARPARPGRPDPRRNASSCLLTSLSPAPPVGATRFEPAAPRTEALSNPPRACKIPGGQEERDGSVPNEGMDAMRVRLSQCLSLLLLPAVLAFGGGAAAQGSHAAHAEAQAQPSASEMKRDRKSVVEGKRGEVGGGG